MNSSKSTVTIVSDPGHTVKFLTVGQVARALSVSRRFVMCRLSELGAIRCGRVYRISLEQLELWIERHRVQQDPVSMNEAATAAVRRALRGIREVA